MARRNLKPIPPRRASADFKVDHGIIKARSIKPGMVIEASTRETQHEIAFTIWVHSVSTTKDSTSPCIVVLNGHDADNVMTMGAGHLVKYIDDFKPTN